jgi:O-antigen ligase
MLLVGALYNAQALTQDAPAWARHIAIEIKAVCEDPSTQWMIVLCFINYIGACAWLDWRQARTHRQSAECATEVAIGEGRCAGSFICCIRQLGERVFSVPDASLLGFVLLALCTYALDYESASKSLNYLGLLSGVAVGKGAACLLTLGYRRRRSVLFPSMCVLLLLVSALAVSAFWDSGSFTETHYRGVKRWSGIWNNPNRYGLLMGTGLVLAAGLFAGSFKLQASSSKRVLAARCRGAMRVLLFAAGSLCAFGLVKSLSRGAWLGTVMGLGCLVWTWRWRLGSGVQKAWLKSDSRKLLAENLRPLFVMFLSIFIICFWEFRHTEHPVFRRVFSVGNVNDFSWRNRVTGWSGGIKAIADKPITGHGWGGWERSFDEKYKADRLEGLGVVNTNDYLTIGISCGLPAVVCLLIHVGTIFRRALFSGGNCGPERTINLQAVCAAGAMVLAVGFFFTSGLVILELGVVFWVLLELARVGSAADEPRMKSLPHAKQSVQVASILATNLFEQKQTAFNTSRFLRFGAIIVVTIAIGLTCLHLGTPQLGVTKRSISIARKYLVPPNQATDFDFLASKPIWSEKKLKTLLTHVELANYTRQLVNWKLDDEIYQEFVLSPGIGARVDADLGWRRELWEYLYPRIRQITDITFAAEAIAKQLKARFSQYPVSLSNPPRPILEVWRSRNQPVSPSELEALTVAALRSAGIPARLNRNSIAEYWDGKAWRLVFQIIKQ